MSDPVGKLPEVGDVLLSKYRLSGILGKGGMGVVFDAHHEILDRPIALKVLSPEILSNSQAVTRFMNEARAVARLNCDHVVAVLDAGTLPSGLPFMVMERLSGTDLGHLLSEGKISAIEDVVDLLLEGIEGVGHAHLEGIIHRDLKPSNLFLARKPDGTEVVKVVDFGISKISDSSGSVTSTATVLGSPLYMSPEQLRNAKTIDLRADIWSLGVIAYELLTGRVPFDGDNMVALFAAIYESSPVPPSSLRPEISKELEAVVLRCLRPERDQRFPSVFSLARALAPFGRERAANVVARLGLKLASKGLTFEMMELPPASVPTMTAEGRTTMGSSSSEATARPKPAASPEAGGASSPFAETNSPVTTPRRAASARTLAIVGVVCAAAGALVVLQLLSARSRSSEITPAATPVVAAVRPSEPPRAPPPEPVPSLAPVAAAPLASSGPKPEPSSAPAVPRSVPRPVPGKTGAVAPAGNAATPPKTQGSASPLMMQPF